MNKTILYELQSSARSMLQSIFIALFAITPQLANATLEEDVQQLETYCYQYALKYDYFNEKWVPFTNISRELPNAAIQPELL